MFLAEIEKKNVMSKFLIITSCEICFLREIDVLKYYKYTIFTMRFSHLFNVFGYLVGLYLTG